MWAITLIQAGTFVALLGVASRITSLEFKEIYLPLLGPMLGLFCFASLFTVEPGMTAEALVMLIAYSGIFIVTVHCVDTRHAERQFVYVIIAAGIFISIIGILKRFDLNFMRVWEYPEFRWPGYTSLTGPYVNRNHMAGFLEMCIPLSVCLFMIREWRREQKMIIAALLTMLLITLVLTLSRGGWMATSFALLFFAGMMTVKKGLRRHRYLMISAIGVLIGIVVLVNTPVVLRITTLTQGDAIDDMAGRSRVWKGAVGIIKSYPVAGTGPGTFAEVYPRFQLPGKLVLERYAHNDYLQFISETGLGFVPVALWMIFYFYRAGLRKMKSPSRQTRGLTLGAMAGVTALLVHSFTDFNLHIPANAVLFAALAAFVVKPSKKERTDK